MPDCPTNVRFLERAFADRGPKMIAGFSKPLTHNLRGVLHGQRSAKRRYGGMIRHTEGAMLRRWASLVPADGTILEIGCYGGLSTSYLAQGRRDAGNRAHIFAVDPFDSDLDKQADLTDGCVALEAKPSRQSVEDRLHQAGFGERLTLIEGYSQEVARGWDRPIDFLWIDGNHDQAEQDFRDFVPHLTPHARVAIHDAHPRYGLPQVADAARRIFADDTWTDLEHVKSILTAVRRG